MIKVKINDNLHAILNYLRSYEYHIDLIDLVQWCDDFGYYKELYEHFHILYPVLIEHNRVFKKSSLDNFTYSKEESIF